MNETGFTFFDTAVGRCGIAWGSRGVVAVLLPEKTDAAARARLLRRRPDAREATPPPEIQRAIDDIVALLAGEARDLADVPLDLGVVPAFPRRVYEVARTIQPGSTLSYGEVATRLGEPQAAREVGEALGKNPFPIVVPCHRVLAAGGKLGGFSARGGRATKLRLLEIEGALAPEAPMLFDDLPRAVR
jgi:methylated-DNA-[protein]-cysteine S-methyltransferase